jgi:hypothetical protein
MTEEQRAAWAALVGGIVRDIGDLAVQKQRDADRSSDT